MNKAENMVFKVERGASKMEDNIKLLPYLLKNFYELDYHKIQNMPHEYDNLLKRPTSGFDHDRISYLKPINKNKTYTMYYRKQLHYYKVYGKFLSSIRFHVVKSNITIPLEKLTKFVIFEDPPINNGKNRENKNETQKSQFGKMFGKMFGRSKTRNKNGNKNGTHKSQFGNMFGKMFGRSKTGKNRGNNNGNNIRNNRGKNNGNNGNNGNNK